jgi:hypothetical protein
MFGEITLKLILPILEKTQYDLPFDLLCVFSKIIKKENCESCNNYNEYKKLYEKFKKHFQGIFGNESISHIILYEHKLIMKNLKEIETFIQYTIPDYEIKIDKLNENLENALKEKKELKSLNKWVEEFRADNKKVVIISTYHSLHKLRELKLGAIYCDEAHALASEDSTNVFKKNFSCLNFKKSYFLTATPKDGVEDNPYSFLMNNEDIFGQREQMNVREAYKLGYITKPVVHMAVPENYNNEDMNQLRNKVKFIIHTFGTHEKFVKEATDTPELIGGKLLIKCESVDVMWKIYDSLLNKNLQNIDSRM